MRAVDRAGRRWLLLLSAAVIGAVTAVAVVTGVGVLLQPRFTVIELSAQRLVPDDLPAQPPVEQVAPFSAFDRRYTVRFDTPDSGLSTVVSSARGQRWRVVSRPRDGAAVLERDGVRAVITAVGPVTRIETRVAPYVRQRQRTARLLAPVAGAALGMWWAWLQIRGPRLRTVRSRGPSV